MRAQRRQSAKLFSSRRNWDSPNPSPAGECAPPASGGSGTLACERGVGRVPIPTRGHTLQYFLYIRTFCMKVSLLVYLKNIGDYMEVIRVWLIPLTPPPPRLFTIPLNTSIKSSHSNLYQKNQLVNQTCGLIQGVLTWKIPKEAKLLKRGISFSLSCGQKLADLRVPDLHTQEISGLVHKFLCGSTVRFAE